VHDLQQAYDELGVWLSALEFKRKVDALSAQVSSHSYFTRPYKSLREAWVLAAFARLINADSVRLNTVQDSDADGYVKISGTCRNVQIIWGDRDDRKIDDEYKPDPGYKVLTCERINDADDVAKALATAIEKKVKKRYASRPMLVVDLNLGVHGREDEQLKLRSRIATLKGQYAQHFNDIYVLQSGELV
jgi:hypothetical protein